MFCYKLITKYSYNAQKFIMFILQYYSTYLTNETYSGNFPDLASERLIIFIIYNDCVIYIYMHQYIIREYALFLYTSATYNIYIYVFIYISIYFVLFRLFKIPQWKIKAAHLLCVTAGTYLYILLGALQKKKKKIPWYNYDD